MTVEHIFHPATLWTRQAAAFKHWPGVVQRQVFECTCARLCLTLEALMSDLQFEIWNQAVAKWHTDLPCTQLQTHWTVISVMAEMAQGQSRQNRIQRLKCLRCFFCCVYARAEMFLTIIRHNIEIWVVLIDQFSLVFFKGSETTLPQEICIH